mmetsp:Transcript_26747/g.89548  ORF Transcript_26747/g.89548 Transcript_26747/m.89548 type:complete len:221 (-) Transcript_26747:346-1008(-)
MCMALATAWGPASTCTRARSPSPSAWPTRSPSRRAWCSPTSRASTTRTWASACASRTFSSWSARTRTSPFTVRASSASRSSPTCPSSGLWWTWTCSRPRRWPGWTTTTRAPASSSSHASRGPRWTGSAARPSPSRPPPETRAREGSAREPRPRRAFPPPSRSCQRAAARRRGTQCVAGNAALGLDRGRRAPRRGTAGPGAGGPGTRLPSSSTGDSFACCD